MSPQKSVISLPPPRQPGVTYKTVVWPSGKRMRYGYVDGKVIERAKLPRTRMTRSRRRLYRARRRIGL